MYADPSHIRSHVVKVRLNDEQMRLLSELARESRAQNATKAHELLVEQLVELSKLREQLDHGEATHEHV